MKFCSKCGGELMDEAVLCPNCGFTVDKSSFPVVKNNYRNTKFCTYCGAEVLKDAVLCMKCGCSLKNDLNRYEEEKHEDISNTIAKQFITKKFWQNEYRTNNGLQTAAKIFMIISAVFWALTFLSVFFVYSSYEELPVQVFIFLLPLTWIIPMIEMYVKHIKGEITVGIGFKICTLLFVNQIAGILMLCDRN